MDWNRFLYLELALASTNSPAKRRLVFARKKKQNLNNSFIKQFQYQSIPFILPDLNFISSGIAWYEFTTETKNKQQNKNNEMRIIFSNKGCFFKDFFFHSKTFKVSRLLFFVFFIPVWQQSQIVCCAHATFFLFWWQNFFFLFFLFLFCSPFELLALLLFNNVAERF